MKSNKKYKPGDRVNDKNLNVYRIIKPICNNNNVVYKYMAYDVYNAKMIYISVRDIL